MFQFIGALCVGALAGCAAPLEAPPPPPPLAPTTPPAASLASLEGRWVNPDQRQSSLVLGMTITAAGQVEVDRPHDPRLAIAFERFSDGAIFLRSRYRTRADVCVPAGAAPAQRLDCSFTDRAGGPRSTYVLNRTPAR
jgi:hypothetical protein